MPRTPTTFDVFNAIAEPRRREIVGLLASGRFSDPSASWSRRCDLAQPAVSKHLAVLRAVGVVSVRKLGKCRMYTLNPAELKSVHDWVKPYERYWTNQLTASNSGPNVKSKERSERN